MNNSLTKLFRFAQFSSRFSTQKAATKTGDKPSNPGKESALIYNPWQAIRLLRAHTHIAYDETVDVCIHLNVNPKIGDHIVRGTAVMPAGTGKKVVVAALCPPDMTELAKQSGADIVDPAVIFDQVDFFLNFR